MAGPEYDPPKNDPPRNDPKPLSESSMYGLASDGLSALGSFFVLPIPTEQLREVSWFSALMNFPPLKALLPIPILLIIFPIIWRIARSTWQQLEKEAVQERAERTPGEIDYRPAVCMLITAGVLTIQEYYGGRSFFEDTVGPELARWHQAGADWLKYPKFKDLYAYGWWVTARVVGYVFIPFGIWKIVFPKDSLLDMGLRIGGFLKHLWIYAACLAVVVPVMFIVAQQPDFGNYYPFYKLSSRSWFDFLAWESIYWLQFFSLELFFRGWMIQVMRRAFGPSAIFVMALPYCMIHFGKPYLEAHGAVIAGIVLGTLSMRTRSIYAGFLLHITVAVGMDLLSLYKRSALPSVFWAPG